MLECFRLWNMRRGTQHVQPGRTTDIGQNSYRDTSLFRLLRLCPDVKFLFFNGTTFCVIDDVVQVA